MSPFPQADAALMWWRLTHLQTRGPRSCRLSEALHKSICPSIRSNKELNRTPLLVSRARQRQRDAADSQRKKEVQAVSRLEDAMMKEYEKANNLVRVLNCSDKACFALFSAQIS